MGYVYLGLTIKGLKLPNIGFVLIVLLLFVATITWRSIRTYQLKGVNMKLYTDTKTGKQYLLGSGSYSRTVTQYPAGCKVWSDGSSSSSQWARQTIVFETQAARSSWVRMMQFAQA
jgi:hypothetical protein